MFMQKRKSINNTPPPPTIIHERTNSKQIPFSDDLLPCKPIYLQLPSCTPEKLTAVRRQILGVCIEAGKERQKKEEGRKKAEPPVRNQQMRLFGNEMICPRCLSENAVIQSDEDGDYVRCSCGYNERGEQEVIF